MASKRTIDELLAEEDEIEVDPITHEERVRAMADSMIHVFGETMTSFYRDAAEHLQEELHVIKRQRTDYQEELRMAMRRVETLESSLTMMQWKFELVNEAVTGFLDFQSTNTREEFIEAFQQVATANTLELDELITIEGFEQEEIDWLFSDETLEDDNLEEQV